MTMKRARRMRRVSRPNGLCAGEPRTEPQRGFHPRGDLERRLVLAIPADDLDGEREVAGAESRRDAYGREARLRPQRAEAGVAGGDETLGRFARGGNRGDGVVLVEQAVQPCAVFIAPRLGREGKI